jgi:hypothetical protein
MRPLHDEHHGTPACHDIDSCPVSEPEFTASLLLDSGCLSKIKVIKTRDKPPVIPTALQLHQSGSENQGKVFKYSFRKYMFLYG